MFVVDELVDCMSHIFDKVVKQIAKSSLTSDNPESFKIDNNIILMFNILNINDIIQLTNAITLHYFSHLLKEDIIDVIYNSNLLLSWDNLVYFTSASLILFPCDIRNIKICINLKSSPWKYIHLCYSSIASGYLLLKLKY